MAVSRLPQPSHRLFVRLVVGILVVALAVTTFLVARSQRSETSVKPSAPAVTIPSEHGIPYSGPGATPGSDDSTCLTVVRHTRIC